MFRKSAATLFNFSKSIRSTPPVSQTFQRGYFTPDITRVLSSGYDKIVQSVDKAAVKEAASLSATMTERASKIKELGSLREMLEKENAKDKERFSLVVLHTDEKAKSIVQRSKKIEADLMKSFKNAVLNKDTRCEFYYLSGAHLNFLQTVLDEFDIKMVIAEFNEPYRRDGIDVWCELHLPETLKISEKKFSGDAHPIYSAWLNGFRDQLNAVIALVQTQEYRPNCSPML